MLGKDIPAIGLIAFHFLEFLGSLGSQHQFWSFQQGIEVMEGYCRSQLTISASYLAFTLNKATNVFISFSHNQDLHPHTQNMESRTLQCKFVLRH